MNSNNQMKNTISFKEKKNLVEGYIKIKQARGNINIEKEKNNQQKKELKKDAIKEDKKEEKKDGFSSGFDIIDDNEVNTIKNYESQEQDMDNNEKNIDDLDIVDLDGPLSKSDVNLTKIKINLWELIAISNSIKKNTKNYLMKSLVSNIVYSSITFKDKLNDSTSKKPIIIYDKLEDNFSPKLLKKIQEVIHMREVEDITGEENIYVI